MTAKETASKYKTNIEEMASAWKCSASNLYELFKNKPHKFKIIAMGTKKKLDLNDKS